MYQTDIFEYLAEEVQEIAEPEKVPFFKVNQRVKIRKPIITDYAETAALLDTWKGCEGIVTDCHFSNYYEEYAYEVFLVKSREIRVFIESDIDK